jgi:hypothetical protein
VPELLIECFREFLKMAEFAEETASEMIGAKKSRTALTYDAALSENASRPKWLRKMESE